MPHHARSLWVNDRETGEAVALVAAEGGGWRGWAMMRLRVGEGLGRGVRLCWETRIRPRPNVKDITRNQSTRLGTTKRRRLADMTGRVQTYRQLVH